MAEGLLLLAVCCIYLIVVVPLVVWLIGLATGSRKAKWLSLSVLLTVPFWYWWFFAVLFMVIPPDPLQEIHQTVSSPESVYWQDDVWPGFDDSARAVMVWHYLDGVHLKVLAVNGDDGKVYLYQADEATFAEVKRLGPALTQKNKEIRAKVDEIDTEVRRVGNTDQEVLKLLSKRRRELDREREKSPEQVAYVNAVNETQQGILDRVEVFDSAAQLPPMRYRVHFEQVSQWGRKIGIFHADRISIIETASNKVIAWSQRYMPVTPQWLLVKAPPQYWNGGPGDRYPYQFDDDVLFTYIGARGAAGNKDRNYFIPQFGRPW
jgi:Methyl-accepting chemotaxis protein